MKLLSIKSLFNKFLIIIIFTFNYKCASAQINLVPNASFEVLDSCPGSFGNNLRQAHPWDTLISGGGGTEVFNSCSGLIGPFGVPLNPVAFQYARTGESYTNSGFFCTCQYTHKARDYLQVMLLHSLSSGQNYCITFYINLTNRSKYAIDEIGAYFDNGSISTCWYCPAIANPQVVSPNNFFISDTANWVKIQGSFVANGTESYLTLGNFKSDSLTDTILNRIDNFSAVIAEYLIDDVSVIAAGSSIHADNDTSILLGDTILLGKNIEGFPVDWFDINGNLIAASSQIYVAPTINTKYIVKMDLCGFISYDTVTVTVNVQPSSINDFTLKNNINIYPNPVTNLLIIQSANRQIENIEVYNILGELQNIKIENQNPETSGQKSTTQQIQLDVSKLANGLYLVVFKDKKTNEKTIKKLIIQNHD